MICFIGSGNLVNDNVNQKSLRLVQGKVFQIMLLFIELCICVDKFKLIIILHFRYLSFPGE